MSLEIHGMLECPFAWRARLVAAEKGLPVEWLPYDVAQPDPRVADHNATKKSPKLWEDGYTLVESLVIAQYLDEGKAGRALQPADARARAAMRLRVELIARKLEGHPTPEHPPDRKLRERVAKGYEQLAKSLEGPWLGGAEPDLSDLAIWPFLHLMDEAGLKPPGPVAAYLARARARASFKATAPKG